MRGREAARCLAAWRSCSSAVRCAGSRGVASQSVTARSIDRRRRGRWVAAEAPARGEAPILLGPELGRSSRRMTTHRAAL